MESRKKSRSLTRGVFVGIILGVLSLGAISTPIIKNPAIQILNLLLSPLFLGLLTMSLGVVYEKYSKTPAAQDPFFMTLFLVLHLR